MADSVKNRKRINVSVEVGTVISVARTYFDGPAGISEKFSETLPSTVLSLTGKVVAVYPGRRAKVKWDHDGIISIITLTNDVAVLQADVENEQLPIRKPLPEPEHHTIRNVDPEQGTGLEAARQHTLNFSSDCDSDGSDEIDMNVIRPFIAKQMEKRKERRGKGRGEDFNSKYSILETKQTITK